MPVNNKQPHVSPDSFFHAFSTAPSALPEAPLTIYFITGNPGLIGYYHTFLSLLSGRIKQLAKHEDQKCSFQIYGHSLAGFELSDPGKKEQDSQAGTQYYDLEQQIRFVQSKLHNFTADRADEANPSLAQPNLTPPSRPKVILIGHSVGAYIAMEVLRRHREGSQSDRPVDFDIIGGVMLFPTVVDIAKSPSGQKLAVCSSPPLLFAY